MYHVLQLLRYREPDSKKRHVSLNRRSITKTLYSFNRYTPAPPKASPLATHLFARTPVKGLAMDAFAHGTVEGLLQRPQVELHCSFRLTASAELDASRGGGQKIVSLERLMFIPVHDYLGSVCYTHMTFSLGEHTLVPTSGVSNNSSYGFRCFNDTILSS